MSVELRGKTFENISLAKFNSWRVGGKARQLYQPADIADLGEFLSTLSADDIPVFLGLGSNVLIADQGIKQTVILTKGGLDQLKLVDDNSFYVEAGVTCAKAAKFCVEHNFIDGEFFAGIPGTIGGALAMNAGAFGGETWRYITKVETVDRQGERRTRYPSDYDISYRSVKGPGITEGEPEWFVAAYFQLPKGDGQQTKNNIKALLQKRNLTQPIGLPSCGSVFINPEGDHAGRLIEALDLKGFRIGGAEISLKHANFIINTGDATAQDMVSLIRYVQQRVKEKFGISLRTEVRFLGFEDES
jgi:UDP-N-acetylmuramate dehydrogenase